MNTNTPLQALVMLNDPQVLEAARVLAEKTTAEPLNLEQKIELIFKKIICRKPSADEIKILSDYYEESLIKAKAEKESIQKLTRYGEYPVKSSINEHEVYGLMKVILTVYNMDEAIVKT